MHVYLMAGASLEHNQVASNVNVALSARLAERGCRVMQSGMRVRLPGGRYTYPDVVALCAEPKLADERPPSLLNPELIVEVTSDSTAERDRTWKLEHYLALKSLREYWILQLDAPRLQQHVCSDGQWIVCPVNPDDITTENLDDSSFNVRSEAFALDVPLAELYRLVDFA